MRIDRNYIVYGLLAVVLGTIGVWHVLEHHQVKQGARAALLNRALDISNSLSVVIRSQRHFGFVLQPRLEMALQELSKSDELISIALLNSTGEVVASAGEPLNLNAKDLPQQGERWNGNSVTFVNLVDLGLDERRDIPEQSSATIVVPVTDMMRRDGRRDDGMDRKGPDNRGGQSPGMGRRDGQRGDEPDRRGPGGIQDDEFFPPPPPPGEELMGGPFGIGGATIPITADMVMRRRPGMFPPDATAAIAAASGQPLFFQEPRRPPRFFGRPPWLSEAQYNEMIKKQGLHGFVLLMSADSYWAEIRRDMWLRLAMSIIALLAVVGLGAAWRNMARSSELQLRLIRASEMNARLREMNLAAAGLAHETRNPLNIVRGLAQLISKREDASEEVRARSRDITEEVDRVTAQLNEFIEYSRPREPKPASIPLNAVVKDVARTLESDMEDKSIQFEISGPETVVQADELLLRQVLFNLMLNSIQASPRQGKIEIRIAKSRPDEYSLEVRDDGPGIPEHEVEKIFRPYYTANKNGTGLGLAVVMQIVLAHGWDIQYVSSGHGSIFRLSEMKAAS
ncbi:MAG: ATP-binding protein [Candidatus Omnitrophota bacterium]